MTLIAVPPDPRSLRVPHDWCQDFFLDTGNDSTSKCRTGFRLKIRNFLVLVNETDINRNKDLGVSLNRSERVLEVEE